MCITRLVAVTTVHGGRPNGQIAVTALGAGILRERPRVLIELWKVNLTHDLVLASGVFALHLLRAEPDHAWRASLDLVHALGLRSGHARRQDGKPAGSRGRDGQPHSAGLAQLRGGSRLRHDRLR
jgi:hypothetical protein